MKHAAAIFACLALLAVLTPASAERGKRVPPQPPIPPPAETLPPASVAPREVPPAPSARTALATIHFDFNRADIRPGDALLLKANAEYMRANPGRYLLAGHCDPIGTDEYNRGLGLRRANAARAHLIKLGINPSWLSVTSFGKERLVTTDPSEYELNRRVEFEAQ